MFQEVAVRFVHDQGLSAGAIHQRLASLVGDKLGRDFKENFDRGFFRMDMSFVAQSERVASILGIKNESLDTVKS
jgi:hypothetical protein